MHDGGEHEDQDERKKPALTVRCNLEDQQLAAEGDSKPGMPMLRAPGCGRPASGANRSSVRTAGERECRAKGCQLPQDSPLRDHAPAFPGQLLPFIDLEADFSTVNVLLTPSMTSGAE